MAEYEKYRKEEHPDDTAAQRKKDFVALQPFLTSLLCMIVCVTMFLGTTFAWFTSSVTNNQNVITVGTLQADLLLWRDTGGTIKVSLHDNSTIKVFSSNDEAWTPGMGYTRTLTVKNEGTLPFAYTLSLKSDNITTFEKDVAKQFVVFVYEHTGDNVTVPASVTLSEMTQDGSQWTQVSDTLWDILNGSVPVFSSGNNALGAGQIANYTIALCLKDINDNTLQGASMDFDILLTATQVPTT